MNGTQHPGKNRGRATAVDIMIIGGIVDIVDIVSTVNVVSVKSFANFVGTVTRLPATTHFSN